MNTLKLKLKHIIPAPHLATFGQDIYSSLETFEAS